MNDAELRAEIKLLHNQAVRVWAALDDRSKHSIGAGFKGRRKLTERAWKITDMTWPLLRDGMKEYDSPQ